jgi:hypothetical protein
VNVANVPLAARELANRVKVRPLATVVWHTFLHGTTLLFPTLHPWSMSSYVATSDAKLAATS